MFYPMLKSIIFSPLVSNGLIIVFLLIILSWLIYEWNELKIRKKCKEQNLNYVRTPSQMFAIAFKKHFNLIENDLLNSNGPVYGCNMMNQLTITISNPELVQIVCNREFTKLANRRVFKSNDVVFDNFLFSTNDEKWKRIRAIVSPTFSSGKLRKVKFCIDDTVETMVQHLNTLINTSNNKNNSIVNMKSVIGSFTMDTIIQMAYGVKIDSLSDPNNKTIQMAKKLFSTDISLHEILFFTISFLKPELNKLLGLKFQAESMEYFRNCSLEIIQKKREELKSKKIKNRASNFIELCLEVEQEQDEQHQQQQHNGNGISNGNGTANGTENGKPFKYLTNDELLAQCITFFTVGYDTTATAITNVCYALASNPEKQELLHKNIMETLKKLSDETNGQCTDPNELITFDTLNQFEYLSAVLDEAMRLYTIATATERLASDDLHLETSDKKISFNVKKGDILRLSVHHLHHNPENFSKPNQFIPERFLTNDNNEDDNDNDNNQKNNNTNCNETCNRQAFLPFGSGPRNCLARSLARLEAKMAIVHLFRLFKFSVCDKTKMDFYINADVAITKDLYLKVEKRN